ncbi:hypothetical protein Q3G72_001292 [Acer saccharum]|nr:hypothetical protein Q3G72_001292 [Acer saccharum]
MLGWNPPISKGNEQNSSPSLQREKGEAAVRRRCCSSSLLLVVAALAVVSNFFAVTAERERKRNSCSSPSPSPHSSPRQLASPSPKSLLSGLI